MSRLHITLLLLFSAATSASAGLYLRGGVLLNSPDDLSFEGVSQFTESLDNSTAFSFALGYDMPVVRLEGEVLYMENSVGDNRIDGDVERVAGFANAYFDFSLLAIEAYAGAGLGFANVDLNSVVNPVTDLAENVDFADSDSVFGYQVMAGLRIQIMDTLFAQAGYRYLDLEDVEFRNLGSVASLSGGDHLWELSLGWEF